MAFPASLPSRYVPMTLAFSFSLSLSLPTSHINTTAPHRTHPPPFAIGRHPHCLSSTPPTTPETPPTPRTADSDADIGAAGHSRVEMRHDHSILLPLPRLKVPEFGRPTNNLPTSTFPQVAVKIFYSSGRRPRGKTGYPIALLPTLLGSASAPSRLPRHRGAAALHFKEFLAPPWRYFRFLSSPSLSFPS